MKKVKGTNLIRIKKSELDKEGYKVRTFLLKKNSKEIPRSEPGDLLCMTDKAQDLWVELDNYSAKLINPNKHLVLYK